MKQETFKVTPHTFEISDEEIRHILANYPLTEEDELALEMELADREAKASL